MKFIAVSTFNADGLDLYGRRMMETFQEFWPDDVPLRVYSEGWEGGVDLLSASPWLAGFKQTHRHRPARDYRMDAVRFSHKVAALCHAARDTDADVLIWLDGDIVTHSLVTVADLETLSPDEGQWIAWLDRDRCYPECGFYMLNCRHHAHSGMIGAFEAMYTEGHLFALPEWHDSYVLQHVVQTYGVGVKSISGSGRSSMHPLVNGPLGAWFDHLKGSRKKEGRSRRADFKVNRQEAYWQ